MHVVGISHITIDDFHVFVIEINPFAEFAGTGLFDWIKDKKLLMGQRQKDDDTVSDNISNTEFRYHKQCPNVYSALGNMAPEWRAFVKGKK